jgi:hypothetical protein
MALVRSFSLGDDAITDGKMNDFPQDGGRRKARREDYR